MTTTQAIEQVGRLEVLKGGFSLSRGSAKEMIAQLLKTFNDLAQARQCIDDMIAGGVMPTPNTLKAWARQHEAQRPDGARRRPAVPGCPDCDGSGWVAVTETQIVLGESRECSASARCECRKVG